MCFSLPAGCRPFFVIFALLAMVGNAFPALAIDPIYTGESADCVALGKKGIQNSFNGPKDEINYTNQMLTCWSERLLLPAKTPQRSFLGNGMELFANPAYIAAYSFSKQLCATAASTMNLRGDYPCWFERADATEGVSMEVAAKKEVPKLLFENTMYNRNGTQSVKYTLCTNDDPTKKKEYTRNCNRGKDMILSEYGRGDIDGDHVEDMLVLVKYGDIGDDNKKCFVGMFSRKEGELAHMTNFSPNGLCQ